MKQSALSILIGAIVLAVMLSLAGCSGIALLHAIDNGSTLTPEQIKAFADMNMDAWGCFQLSGPPPNGATTWIVLPKGSDGPTFGEGCRVTAPPIVIQTDSTGAARMIMPNRQVR
jgi:hypothetical protein